MIRWRGLLTVMLVLVLAVSATARAGDDPFEAGTEAMRQKDPDRAILRFTEAIERNPKGDVAYVRRGHAYLLKGEEAKALDDCNTAIRLNPRSVDGYTFRGEVYRARQEYAKALRDYNRAIELDPRAAEAYLYRAVLHDDRGQPAEALADHRKVTELAPDNPYGFSNLGMSLAEAGKTEEAIQALSTAIKLKPDYAGAYAVRGNYYARQKAYRRAVTDYEAALVRGDKQPLLLNNLAWLLATCPDPMARDGRKALVVAKKGAEVTSYRDAGMLDSLAAAYAETGQFVEAAMWQRRSIELLPERSRGPALERLRLYERKMPYRSE